MSHEPRVGVRAEPTVQPHEPKETKNERDDAADAEAEAEVEVEVEANVHSGLVYTRILRCPRATTISVTYSLLQLMSALTRIDGNDYIQA